MLLVFAHASMFLDQGIGVSGKQLGGANTASPEGAAAVYWNMAAFSGQNGEIYFDYASSFLEINKYTFLYGASEEGDSLILGAYRVDAGQVIALVTSNVVPVNVNYADTVVFAGYAFKLAPETSLGLTYKLIQQNFTDVKNSSALDISYYSKIDQNLQFGLVAENAYVDKSEDKPIIRAGVKYSVGKLGLAVDTKYDTALSGLYWSTGASFRVIRGFYLKAGYSSYDEKIFLGTSLDANAYKVDYVYFDSDLGATHQIGMTFNL